MFATGGYAALPALCCVVGAGSPALYRTADQPLHDALGGLSPMSLGKRREPTRDYAPGFVLPVMHQLCRHVYYFIIAQL
jgi:hypothetical protein